MVSRHYTFDERALGQQNLTQSSGELWAAASGGYLVRYELTSKGGADYFGEGIAGTLTQDYELTGVGKPVKVQLPSGCPGGIVDASLLPDASNVSSIPGELNYQTSTSLADAVAFYQKQIPGLGRKLANPPDTAQNEATLDYQQGDQAMSVSITTDAEVTTVDILLVRGQKKGN